MQFSQKIWINLFFFQDQHLLQAASSTFNFLLNCIRILSLTYSGQQLTNELRKARTAVTSWQRRLIANSAKMTSSEYSVLMHQFNLLSKELEENSKLTPGNCFELSNSSQLSGFTVLLTFVIVLFQFRAGENVNAPTFYGNYSLFTHNDTDY